MVGAGSDSDVEEDEAGCGDSTMWMVVSGCFGCSAMVLSCWLQESQLETRTRETTTLSLINGNLLRQVHCGGRMDSGDDDSSSSQDLRNGGFGNNNNGGFGVWALAGLRSDNLESQG